MQHEIIPLPKILKSEEVKTLLGVGTTTLQKLRRTQDFPEPIETGGRRLLWKAEELLEWINSRPRAGRSS